MIAPLLLAAVLAAPDSAARPTAPMLAAPSPPRVSGYVQARSTYQRRANLTNSLNRARLGVDGALPNHVTYRVLVEYEAPVANAAATASLRDAYARWNGPRLTVTAGQFKTPFSRQYVTSITAIDVADRATVVDTLAPKRDLGVSLDLEANRWLTLSSGLFNGEGQNLGTNRDSVSLLVSRAVLHPLPGVDLGGSGAWNGTRTQRYGLEASLEWRGLVARGEWIGQRRKGANPDDDGWFGLVGYRVEPRLQLIAEQEDFQRPTLGTARRMSATTLGANVDLPGGRNRFILEYVAHRTGTPFVSKDTALAQWQVKF